jgi:hypothetical protein
LIPAPCIADPVEDDPVEDATLTSAGFSGPFPAGQ